MTRTNDPWDPQTFTCTADEVLIMDDPRAGEEPDMDAFAVWKKWFRKNCSEWNSVDDVEAELGRDKE